MGRSVISFGMAVTRKETSDEKKPTDGFWKMAGRKSTGRAWRNLVRKLAEEPARNRLKFWRLIGKKIGWNGIAKKARKLAKGLARNYRNAWIGRKGIEN